MRKYLLLLFTIGLFTGCSSDYDDGKLWDSVNDLENRLSALEKQCKEMNTNIESMKVIVDVLKSNDYVTNVTVVTENAGNLIVEVKGTQVALDKQVALKIIAG